ncbi:MAG: RNA pseudouridine synthase [Treponema sp.]|jgi:23S rRNA pseudouridine1911/1915/1917 synthase|nr:RNA pseudouridine synthase [Treponema sp.]
MIQDRLLYASPSCLVLNKLPGEAVEGGGPGMGDLRVQAASLEGGQPVHRLDTPVSGCVLFARNPALAFLNKALAEGQIEKRYWAIVETPADPGVLDRMREPVHWIGRDSSARGKRLNKSKAFAEPGPSRKKAVLRCRLAGRGERYLFLEIELLTGRHHQIRAQLAALGLHIKGDLKYGARRSDKNSACPDGYQGIRLHARSLSFPDPDDSARPRRRITVSAPPVWDTLWKAFERAIIGEQYE